jgi:trans-aconitate 2-methyltransferase
MPSADWSPDQYDRFRDERSQPFFDLLALVRPRPGLRVADLGCGTGELTRVLHERLGARETLGFDSSPAMLEKAQAHAAAGLRFAAGDIALAGGEAGPGGLAGVSPLEGRYDLLFSNAALHWVDGHPDLLQRLAAHLADGGQLAVQVPANHDHPSHLVAAEIGVEFARRSAATSASRASSCPRSTRSFSTGSASGASTSAFRSTATACGRGTRWSSG